MTLKVLHLIDSGGLYGAEVMLLTLVEEQQKQGLLPLIFSVGAPNVIDKAIEVEARKRNLPIFVFRMKEGLNIRKGYEIIRFAKKESFSIVHSHGYKFNILLGIMSGIAKNIRFITTVHGYVHAPKYSKMWINQIVDRMCLKRLDHVVFVSAATRQKFSLKLSNSSVISNGVNISGNMEETQKNGHEMVSQYLANTKYRIGAFGRLAAEKGFDNLINAFKRTLVNIPEASLIIWGEGYERNRLQMMVHELGLSEHVCLPGFTNKASYYLKQIDLLVISSLTEGSPIILLEAMKNKVPVIATNVGEIPHVLDQGRCGYLIPVADTDALIDAISEVKRNKLNCDIKVKAAYERVVHHYSSKYMADRYTNMYKNIIAGKA